MKLKLNKGFISQAQKNSLIIFDTEKSVLYTFNPTAKFIFNCIKKGINIKEIIDNLVKEFGIEEKKAKEDVNEFIKELLSKGIISSR